MQGMRALTHTWMAEPPSTAFAEAPSGENHKNSSQTSFFEPTGKKTLRMVKTHEQEPLPDSCRGSLQPVAVCRGQEVGKTTIRA